MPSVLGFAIRATAILLATTMVVHAQQGEDLRAAAQNPVGDLISVPFQNNTNLLWFEVTRHSTADWLARQITEAFPWTSAPA